MLRSHSLRIPILMLGTFGILSTEMGVIGILPLIAEHFNISITSAGWMVTVFALVVAFSAPIMPLLFLPYDRKKVMMIALAIFVFSNVVSAFSNNYFTQLVFRAIPALFHPVYVTIAFTAAANLVPEKDKPKAAGKIFVAVSAGMVLGVPITSFVAHHWGLQFAMLLFAILNSTALIATYYYFPNMPNKTKNEGSPITILSKKIVWISITATILMNAVLFGFYSYLADYLYWVTELTFNIISILLFIYGIANMMGNLSAGALLTKNSTITLLLFPILLFVTYSLLFWFGKIPIATTILLFFMGFFVGITNNGNQYMITISATEAPEFANGLFLTSANLGTALGTFICGLFISNYGIESIIFAALLFIILAFIFILIRLFYLRNKENISPYFKGKNYG